MQIGTLNFREVWAFDFEFRALPGDRPEPVCLVARELCSGRELRIWRDALLGMSAPPYCVGSESLFVAYYASAEASCHLVLGWPLPENLLDLFVEFRNRTNGLPVPCGNGLLGASAWYGLDAIDSAEKDAMRELAMRTNQQWSPMEQNQLLDYCASDVHAVARLLEAMKGELDLPRALLRGRYMKAAAHIEHRGLPIDGDMFTRLHHGWDRIQDQLIADIDKDYGVYDGRSFRSEKFARFLASQQIAWPMHDGMRLDLRDDTFKEMARVQPCISPLRELRAALSQMRLADLAVGRDNRNRCLLSAFRSRTGRNQPSNTKFAFGPSVWLRGLIKPAPGMAIAYIDWSQQEFGIAAALSGDARMKEAYTSGDPYLSFAKQAGAVPSDATKASHRAQREQFKACVLAVQYGMGADSLALRIGQSAGKARDLLRLHRQTYPVFWTWVEAAVDHAMLHGHLHTVFGWTIRVSQDVNPRFLQNFPMQANGAEMLRLACILGTERGIGICAPVHDAVLIEAPADRINEDVAAMQQVMIQASRMVLGDFELRSDAAVITYPDRYSDDRGTVMWQKVTALLDQVGDEGTRPFASTLPVHAQDGTGSSMHTRPILSISDRVL